MILYKYRPDSNFTESIFKEKKVWFAEPSTLNDPSDCKIAEFEEDYKKAVRETQISNQLQGFVMSMDGFFGELPSPLSADQKKRVMDDFKKANTLEDKFEIANAAMKLHGTNGFSKAEDLIDSIDKQIQQAGIFCLSESCVEVLMWSHYGEKHQGICLGFQDADKSLLDNQLCHKVEYGDKFPSVDILGPHHRKNEMYMDYNGRMTTRTSMCFDDPGLQKALSMKSSDWAYEKEWRIISNRFGEYGIPGKITEVIFGLKCPSEVREKYISLTKNHIEYPVVFKIIAQERNSFKLYTEILK